MSNSKHTPGPWRGNGDESALLDENRSILSESGQEVLTIGWGGSACESDPYGEYPILEASAADWALLLAAPDLLAACEELVAMIDSWETAVREVLLCDPNHGLDLTKARAAIAKAKGT